MDDAYSPRSTEAPMSADTHLAMEGNPTRVSKSRFGMRRGAGRNLTIWPKLLHSASRQFTSMSRDCVLSLISRHTGRLFLGHPCDCQSVGVVVSALRTPLPEALSQRVFLCHQVRIPVSHGSFEFPFRLWHTCCLAPRPKW